MHILPGFNVLIHQVYLSALTNEYLVRGVSLEID